MALMILDHWAKVLYGALCLAVLPVALGVWAVGLDPGGCRFPALRASTAGVTVLALGLLLMAWATLPSSGRHGRGLPMSPVPAGAVRRARAVRRDAAPAVRGRRARERRGLADGRFGRRAPSWSPRSWPC